MLCSGLDGGPDASVITTLADAVDVHPASLVTVKLYVPVASPEIVVPEPVPVIDPGLIVQLPAGRPVNSTLPVARAHVGWVIVPTIGASGVPDAAFMTTLDEAAETHPAAFVTV